jgi:hypothetical protein
MRYVVIPTFPAIALSLALATAATESSASHSWGGYHWARQTALFTVPLGDNLASGWKPYLQTVSADWSAHYSPWPTYLTTAVVQGSATNKQCRPTAGRVQVCDSLYGNNGWLGIAQIWVSGLHITQGSVKLNDTYFNTATYNSSAWRRMVACQEVGHTFGLDHQDTTFTNANLGTCMDYTNDPSGTLYNQLSNVAPNSHDYEELSIIYTHLDSITTVGSTTSGAAMPPGLADVALETPRDWGRLLRSTHAGRTEVYARDLGGGHQVFTFVIWADDDPRHRLR